MGNSEKQTSTELDEKQLIELWKHFAATGGADKDRMVTITTWILGFSAAMLGYLAIHYIDFSNFTVTKPPKTRVFAFLGALVSAYGAASFYSTRVKQTGTGQKLIVWHQS